MLWLLIFLGLHFDAVFVPEVLNNFLGPTGVLWLFNKSILSYLWLEIPTRNCQSLSLRPLGRLLILILKPRKIKIKRLLLGVNFLGYFFNFHSAELFFWQSIKYLLRAILPFLSAQWLLYRLVSSRHFFLIGWSSRILSRSSFSSLRCLAWLTGLSILPSASDRFRLRIPFCSLDLC